MIIRRYKKGDVPDMVKHSREALEAFHYSGIAFSNDKVSAMLIGNLRNPSFFCDVIDVDGEIGGALCAMVSEYIHSYEAYAQDWIFYIRPEYRSLTGAVALIRNYVKWARSRGVRQIRFDQSTGYKMDKFAVLMKRCGFQQIGTKWSMEA